MQPPARVAEVGERSPFIVQAATADIARSAVLKVGGCSLNYLKRFPLDTLKIDRSFVAAIGTDSGDAAIVRAIIALGHDLNLKIVAEGVATLEQLRFLPAEGCDTVQGFLMSPAVPARAFASLLRGTSPGLDRAVEAASGGSLLARLTAAR